MLRGRRAAMVAHFVHKSAAGELGGVGVLSLSSALPPWG